MEVIIPERVRSNQEGYEFLSRLINSSIKSRLSRSLLVNFEGCKSFDGNLAAVLGATLDYLKSKGYKISLTRPTEKNVRRSLGRNHFLQAWSVLSEVEEKENYIEYHRFNSNGPSDEFKEYVISGLIQKQKFPAHSEGVAEKIVENIYEIFVNASTHGRSKYVYACGEYKSDAEILEMTIVDCGTTIPENVNTYLKCRGESPLDSCEAIEWAFVEGNTTKSHPGGLGLSILKDFIKINQGSIQVVSGKGLIEYKGDLIQKTTIENSFPGTVVNMKFNFNDTLKYFLTTEIENININDLL